MIQKEKDIQSHRAVINEFAVTDDVFKKTHQTHLEENNRINRFLTTFTVVRFGDFVKKSQIQYIFESSVKAVLWHSGCQIKRVEQLRMIVFFTLQVFLLIY